MIDLSPEVKSIQSLYRDFSEDKLVVNRRYQRKLVWTLEEKQKLIESILMRYPIPNILLAKTVTHHGESNSFEIIDGMQRLHTIIAFIEQKFATIDGRYFNVNNFPTAKLQLEKQKRSSDEDENIDKSLLNIDDCNKILDYSLSVLIMRDVDTEMIDDVFRRINTYGHRLSNQERRQAGVQSKFSNLVRKIGSELRGDNSSDILNLKDMPSISIESSRNRSGYGVPAENTFWVKAGILNTMQVRDSADEQCVADILASILTTTPLARDKVSLDNLYDSTHIVFDDINKKIELYGITKIYDEFHFCINIFNKLSIQKGERLNRILTTGDNPKSIPAIFANVFIAIFEILFHDKKDISDYELLFSKLQKLPGYTQERARTSNNRQENITQIKALIGDAFAKELDFNLVYNDIDDIDVDSLIQQTVEQPTLEFKQGCVSLNESNQINDDIFDKVIHSICGIANTAKKGVIIIGVADNEQSAERIKALDKIQPKLVYRKYVVGVDREAKKLGLPLEHYIDLWKSKIEHSSLPSKLKQEVLSNFKYIPYHGLGLIILTVPKQNEMAVLTDNDGTIYWRKIDSTTNKIGEIKLTYNAKNREFIQQIMNGFISN